VAGAEVCRKSRTFCTHNKVDKVSVKITYLEKVETIPLRLTVKTGLGF
jgi:hypothetical protein